MAKGFRNRLNENLFEGKDARIVWATAAYGYRLNNYTYNKSDHDSYYDEWHKETIPASISNRTCAYAALAEPDLLEDADYELGEEVHQYFKGLTFKAIMGKLKTFEKSILEFVDIEDWGNNPLATYHFAQLVSLPASYHRNLEREKQDSRVRDANKEYIDDVGARIKVDAEVIRSVYSERWCTNYVTVITDSDQVAFFSYKQALKSGAKIRFTGTVKAHRDDGQTQFNRVKVLDE